MLIAYQGQAFESLKLSKDGLNHFSASCDAYDFTFNNNAITSRTLEISDNKSH